MHLTRPGEHEIAVRSYQEQDGYFLCFKTRVMIAQSIITNVNRSLYVIIGTTPFCRTQNGMGARPPAARLRILYCHGTGKQGLINDLFTVRQNEGSFITTIRSSSHFL